MTIRDVRRFVDDLLHQRRGRRTTIDPAHDDELRAAILLRAARPGAGAPREEFVTALHDRLAHELSAEQASSPSPGLVPVARRRRFVQLIATAAASVAVGVGLDRILNGRSGTPVSGAAGPVGPPLSPEHGVWRTVAVSADLPEGAVLRFDLGVITGFVRRTRGQVAAVSGVCTHLSCQLTLDAPAARLNCPCHGASFAVNGIVLQHRLPIPLAPLPTISTREVDGMVQVFAPSPGA
jgi:nitrite reductase/ring-hydroxylating ferredoxin subunit